MSPGTHSVSLVSQARSVQSSCVASLVSAEFTLLPHYLSVYHSSQHHPRKFLSFCYLIVFPYRIFCLLFPFHRFLYFISMKFHHSTPKINKHIDLHSLRVWLNTALRTRQQLLTCTVCSISMKSIFTRAVVRSQGIVTISIYITVVFPFGTFVSIYIITNIIRCVLYLVSLASVFCC